MISAPTPGPIGIFDSGYGGLTILRDIRLWLPQYDYLYLGDNARAPYGERSFEVVYEFTLQAVKHLFEQGANLVVLACNTASAKALRSIQQNDLPHLEPGKRVLGVIVPTAEELGNLTRNRHIGILATPGTVNSGSYTMEIGKRYPDMHVTETACPMFVPLVEYGEADGDGADYFVKKYLDRILTADPDIDTLVLGCTHYPILMKKIRRFAPEGIRIVAQGEIVAKSLANYLKRHPEMDARCSKDGTLRALTSENTDKFDSLASLFLGCQVNSTHAELGSVP